MRRQESMLRLKRFRVEEMARQLSTLDAMRRDLEAEKAAMTRIWAKREKQLQRMTTGMLNVVGDLQGIGDGAVGQLAVIAALPDSEEIEVINPACRLTWRTPPRRRQKRAVWCDVGQGSSPGDHSCADMTSVRPVMAGGWGMPSTWSIVGATSARMPSRRSRAPGHCGTTK